MTGSVRSLNAIGARYFIAGGLAVTTHGYIRITMDVESLEALVAMEETTGRPRDVDDLEHLR